MVQISWDAGRKKEKGCKVIGGRTSGREVGKEVRREGGLGCSGRVRIQPTIQIHPYRH